MVWLVTADVEREDEYGCKIYCFGIADNETTLELIKNEVKKQGFEPEIKEIEINVILPFNFENDLYDEPYYLGGYAE